MAGNVVTKRVALVGDDGRFDDSMAPAVVVEAMEQTAAAAAAAATSASDALRYRDEALDALNGPPSAHGSSHATGGADALTPADIGAAAADHTHTLDDVSDSATRLAMTAAERTKLAAWDAMAARTYLVPDPTNVGLYLAATGSSMTPDPAHDGLYTIGTLA